MKIIKTIILIFVLLLGQISFAPAKPLKAKRESVEAFAGANVRYQIVKKRILLSQAFSFSDETIIRTSPASQKSLKPENSASPEGYWQGAIEREGKKWRVNLDIKKEGAQYKALADFVDVDAAGLEFQVKQNGEDLRLERPQPNGKAIIFEGKIQGNVFSGSWTGTNTTAVFSLLLTPAPPKYYHEEEITFQNGDIKLSGTLLLPNRSNNFPAVILTHGSGPATRAAYRSWGLRFAKKGIAALIYDKRGNGKSTGDWRSASMENLADDAVAGLNYLKTRPEINAKKIGVAGHSQGGWVAPLAANRSKEAAFVIASAASGVSPDRQSIYHRASVMREMGFSEEAVKIAAELREKLYASGKLLLEKSPNAAKERKKVSAELAKYAKEPWFEAGAELPPNLDNDNPPRGALELLFFNPVPMWEQVKIPVLLMWGDKDTVVPVTEGRKIIENALKTAENTDVTIKIFPNLDHGSVIVRPKNSAWDFPRVDLNYYETMVDWTLAKTKI